MLLNELGADGDGNPTVSGTSTAAQEARTSGPPVVTSLPSNSVAGEPRPNAARRFLGNFLPGTR